MKNRIKKAWVIFKTLRLRKGYYYFIKNKGLGDIVRSLPAVLLFAEYKGGDQIKKITILTTENYAGLVEMNPRVNEVKILTADVMYAIVNHLRILKKFFLVYPDADTLNGVLPIYGIPEKFAEKNKHLQQIPHTLGKKSIETGMRFVIENHLFPEKTLILVPYARGSSSIEPDHLIRVADHFRKLGFRIFTNTVNDGDPVSGTETISASADVVLYVISQGAVVIGVQCGMLDACEWMDLSKRVIKVYRLEKAKDWLYFNNRNGDLGNRIEKKSFGYTIAVSTEEDCMRLEDDIIALSRKMIPDTAVSLENCK